MVILQPIKKWLIITKDSQGASERVGLLNSLEYLKAHKVLDYQVTDSERPISELEWADNIIFSRTIESQMIYVLDTALRKGKITLYYVDDRLFNVPDYCRLNHYYNSEEVQQTLRYFIKSVHQVVTCSKWLSRSYDEQYHCRSTWVQPAVKVNSKSQKNFYEDKIVIGVAGNPDYAGRLEAIKEVFLSLHGKYKKEIQFEFFGPKVSFLDAVEGLYYRPVAYRYYEMYLSRKSWDLGLAYLEDSSFDNCKYFNKYLEYSRFKIPGIYSDIPLYHRAIREGINGAIAKNTCDEWYGQIEKLIQDRNLREQLAENAYNEVVEQFSPQKGAESFIWALGSYL